MIYVSKYLSPIGPMTIASDGEALLGVWFDGQKHYFGSLCGEIRETEVPIAVKTKDWLNRYFRGENPPSDELRLFPEGSAFRQAVRKLLCEIPYGQTVTYGYLAKKAEEENGGKKVSPRAVGGAVGRNPFAIIVPCHRVVGANGNLTGYAAGIDKKTALLALEKKSLAIYF